MNLNHRLAPRRPLATNLIERLRYWCQQQPSQPAYYYLDQQGQVTELTYAQLDQQARTIAARLSAMELGGERALLLYPPGLEFVAAFFGCLYAGTIAVPAFPPRRNRNMARIEAISEDAQAAIVLSVQEVVERSQTVLDNDARHLKEIPWLATDQLLPVHSDVGSAIELVGDGLAVLQYTSGSTGRPKGVMLTHANLMHNCSLITNGFEADQTSMGLSWLPTYHDMGLVGGILNPMYVGRPSVLMSPISFLQKPVRWLHGISRFKVTISGGPNFAYALCTARITDEDCEGLDLSSWKVAFNGAEPVRAETLARFTKKFQPYGFRAETHYPCYGLAETTLIVSGSKCRERPCVRTFDATALETNRVVQTSNRNGSSRKLVGSGHVLPDQHVLIVDPESRLPVSSDQVGEIWVSSPSVAQGYWNNPRETQQAFHGRLANNGNQRFLRTGDLGFFFDDQLFVTGRIKDLIIINGRNLYPHDIESIVERTHAAIRSGGGVAFSIEHGNTEQLVIAQELERGYRKFSSDEILAAVRKAVFEGLDVTPHTIVLLKAGKLPKTSSGKVQRRACRNQFLADQLDVIARWTQAPSLESRGNIELDTNDSPESRSVAAIEAWLVLRIGGQMNIPPENLDVNSSFAHFGLDSVALFGISGDLEDWMNCSVSPKLLFQYPTIAELAAHLDSLELPDEKNTVSDPSVGRCDQNKWIGSQCNKPARELLANLDSMSEVERHMLLAELLSEKAAREITTHDLSHGQRALWFIYQMNPASAAYNIMYAARVRVDLDRDALLRAFQTIMNRHQVLRTTYATRDGTPVRHVHPCQDFALRTIDARDWEEEKLDEEIQFVADTPFDLENGPVVRAWLFERRGEHHVLLFTAHHIALDFWALDLLFDQLQSLYREEISGIPAEFSNAKLSYDDFVDWQQQILNSQEGTRMRDYWHQQLAGNLPILDLPTDYQRPPQQSFRGKSFHFELPNQLLQKLVELSKSEDATLFVTLLTAFHVLLYRYSGQNDILVGSPTAGRNRREFADVPGYFVNPVVLRSQPTANETFKSFLAQVRNTAIDGITNQEYPFPILVQGLKPQRDTSRSPIFQVAFGWEQLRKLHLAETPGENLNGKPVDAGCLGLEPISIGQQGSAFDLMLMVHGGDQHLSAAFQYNLDLFSQSTIVRMADHFQTLLGSIVDDPECSLAELSLLNTLERQLLLDNWNETTAEYPCDVGIHDLFQLQVKRTPDSIAVESGNQKLTYRELNERANQVARYLRNQGVSTDDLVGVYLRRSTDLMVGLLGVLKAGGAYVPLAPGTPRERLGYMLDEIHAPVVLTQTELANDLPEFDGHIVCLDIDWPTISKQDDTDPEANATPTDLAYVIFTSGSTGQPKGVEVEHRAVINFLTSMQRQPGINPDDVLLAVTTVSFDIAVLELFLPLMTGAKVVIAGDGVAGDGVRLAETIRATKTTLMQATPATWRLLLAAGWQGDRQLKILCGGEAFPADLAERLLGCCGNLWNMYGPTETTIWSTVDHVQQSSEPMPIGRPIANTKIFILDKQLEPVPFGVTGDLYIGGDGLARGYLNRPELTAEKFIINTFGDDGESLRLYQTGDLGRYRADGKIEFLGREDFQVKVRGFRIELGEIETQLAHHPAIRHAVVTARDCNGKVGHKQLVAYFTHRDNVPNTGDLRDFLKRNLPDYMVPSTFVPLGKIPLNAAGKIDRSALPEPDRTRPDLRASFVGARNATEELLAEVWARVLGLEQVGIHDNFFELGGASLQSLEITSLASDVGIEMVPASLFQHPTIAELAANGLSIVQGTVGDKIAATAPQHVTPRPQPKKTALPKTEKTNIVIESIGVYLPLKSVTTNEVIAGCKKRVWFPLQHMTGIKSRRVAADDQCTADLAYRAVEECLDNSQYTPDQIDLVVCCHINRGGDPRSAILEPGTAMFLKQRFHFPNAIALDITNACAGMFTGVSIAESYIRSGAAQRVMVVSAEYLSPVTTTAQKEITDFMDPRIACLTLGDAGAAIIIEASSGNDVGFHELEMYSLSKYSQMCVGRPTELEHGGPILEVPDPIRHTTIAIENSIAHSKLLLDQSTWEPDQIHWVIMHQTSERSLMDGARAINKTFGRRICTQANTINNLADRGNTASTSHFVAVWDNILNGRIQAGHNAVFAITGSGQTIGTGIYTFDDLPDRIRQRKATGAAANKSVGLERIAEPIRIGSVSPVRVAAVGVISTDNKTARETMPMVKEAVHNCLANSQYETSDIDLVLYAGVYRTDFISEPALATMIAGELKINDEIKPEDNQRTFAFDVINGGVGFLSACDIAAQMIRSGMIRTALVIASEIENNREHYPEKVLGLKETASAVILEQGSCNVRVGFGEFVFKYMTDELNARTVIGKYMKGGPPCVHLDQDPSVADYYLKMIPQAVTELLERECLQMSQIDIVMPPQFCGEFLNDLSGVLNIHRERFVDLTGDGKDWFTSSLPRSMHEIAAEGIAKPGDIGLVINVGAGLQVGCAAYYF